MRVVMTPLGWALALRVWIYVLGWLFLNDFAKLPAYRVFDPANKPITGRSGRMK